MKRVGRALSQGEVKSPLIDNVINIMSSATARNDKIFRKAFEFAAGIIFVLVFISGLAAIYSVLQPFFRPLLWAVLLGSFLYPLKFRVTELLRAWLRHLKTGGTPLVIGIASLPLTAIDDSTSFLGKFFKKNKSVLGSASIGVPLFYVLCCCTPVGFMSSCFSFMKSVLLLPFVIFGTLPPILIWTIILGYFVGVSFFWHPWMDYCSTPVWLLSLPYFTSVLGILQTPAIVTVLALSFLGFTDKVKESLKKETTSSFSDYLRISAIVIKDAASLPLLIAQKPEEGSQVKVEEVDSGKPPLKSWYSFSSPSGRSSGRNSPSDTSEISSNLYLLGVFWACLIVMVWKHIWLLSFLPIPVAYYSIKVIGSYCGLWDFCGDQFQKAQSLLSNWCHLRKNALVPPPLRVMFRMVKRGDRLLLSSVLVAVDTLATVGILVVGLLVLIFATLFLALKIHGEGMHLVMVSSSLINQTIVQSPGLLPDDFDQNMQNMLGNGYVYGREWIADKVKVMSGEEDEIKAAEIQRQALMLWDNIYDVWLKYNNASDSSNAKTLDSWDNVMENFKTSKGLLNVSGLVKILGENIEFMTSVAHSIWNIAISNVNLAFNAFTSVIQIVMGGSTAVINFFVNAMIFLSTLVILLTASEKTYKPVELLASFSPGTSKSLAGAIEDAVNSVFIASLKMAGFYGMWTWLIHQMFSVKLVYIPSALASLLAAVPILGPYWAALPAVIELWLVDCRGTEAALLFAAQLLPMWFVDQTIYSEIRGAGHPYLTGLSIAGGIFYLGVEGAIFGPVLLCCLFVGMNIYRSFLESPKDEAVKTLFIERPIVRSHSAESSATSSDKLATL